jgi:PKHD-type hydroxylase
MYKNHYWLFDKALDEKSCNKIIQEGLSKKKEKAKVGEDIVKKENLKLRVSNITWLEQHWIYDLIFPFLNTANVNAGWNYQYDWAEACQFTVYEKNHHYNWHCDSFEEPYPIDHKFENFRGKTRKLSMSICLSNEDDFSGGDFQFDYRNRSDGKPNIDTVKEIRNKGSILVFPSNIYHRVTPVKKGTRHSLVVWFLGQPFK